VQGPAVVRPYTAKYQVTFPVVVDTADIFGSAFGLKVVPTTFYIDEVGIVRLSGGGPQPGLLQQLEQLLREPILDVRGAQPKLPAALTREQLAARVAANGADWEARLGYARVLDGENRHPEALAQLVEAAKTQPRNAEVLFTWGMVLLHQQNKDAALAKLKEARDLDPKNWLIRKQIWAIENPEKFYSGHSPDYGWQKEELAREQKSGKN
jgi:tetratricopeptide (TPR) repeat protein